MPADAYIPRRPVIGTTEQTAAEADAQWIRTRSNFVDPAASTRRIAKRESCGVTTAAIRPCFPRTALEIVADRLGTRSTDTPWEQPCARRRYSRPPADRWVMGRADGQCIVSRTIAPFGAEYSVCPQTRHGGAAEDARTGGWPPQPRTIPASAPRTTAILPLRTELWKFTPIRRIPGSPGSSAAVGGA